MSEVTVERYSAALTAAGPRPLGADEYKFPEVLSPSWNFRWPGPGPESSMVDGVLGLLDRLAVERRNGEPLVVVPKRSGEGHSDLYSLPTRDLNGELREHLRLGMMLSCGALKDATDPSGLGISATLQVSFDFHWFAPLSPGLFHDNREWSSINRPLVRELFVGLHDLGFIYGPRAEESRISPLDAFGFADVNVDWLKAQLAETWRSVVEGRASYEHLTVPLPHIPKADPIEWSLLGFEWSEDELFELYDGVLGGAEAVRRLLPRQSIVESPQIVGDREDLLETATELRDQIAVALSGVDDELANRYRSLPVLMESEVSEQDQKNIVNANRIVFDLLSTASRKQPDVSRLHELHVARPGLTDSWANLHLMAPVSGLDCDLSAAVSMWGKSGALVLTEKALFVKLSSDHWIRTWEI